MISRDQHREVKPRQGDHPQSGQVRGQRPPSHQDNPRNQPRPTQGANFRTFGRESDSRRRRDEGRAYGASSHEYDDDRNDYDNEGASSSMAFSATQEDYDDDNDKGDDRMAMMGRRDYRFDSYDEEDGDHA